MIRWIVVLRGYYVGGGYESRWVLGGGMGDKEGGVGENGWRGL